MSVTRKIMTQGMRPQFVELFPRGMATSIGPLGVSATPTSLALCVYYCSTYYKAARGWDP